MKYAQRMVLAPESETDRERARKETERLAKAVRMKDQAKIKQWQTNPTPPGIVPRSVIPTLLEISSSLPPMYQPKAKRLLDEMLSAGFTWSASKELILPSTEIVPNSNIEAILKEALVRGSASTKPIGWREFISFVSQSSIPLGLLTKKSTQNDLKQLKKSKRMWEIY